MNENISVTKLEHGIVDTLKGIFMFKFNKFMIIVINLMNF